MIPVSKSVGACAPDLLRAVALNNSKIFVPNGLMCIKALTYFSSPMEKINLKLFL